MLALRCEEHSDRNTGRFYLPEVSPLGIAARCDQLRTGARDTLAAQQTRPKPSEVSEGQKNPARISRELEAAETEEIEDGENSAPTVGAPHPRGSPKNPRIPSLILRPPAQARAKIV